jgi:divalent metal cation (Fe/Co/Zn/Cd) transporter
MSLGEAHAIATRFENAVKDEIGLDAEVETHIEPLETEEIPGRNAEPNVVQAITEGLTRRALETGRLRHIHNVRARHTPSGLWVNFHCRIGPQISVGETHRDVDTLERAVRGDFPNIARVIGHAEPAVQDGA